MKQRIFVLDDEREMTQLTQTLLSLRGFEVVCSNDPQEALASLANASFDLIFVDLMMPGVNGFQVVKTIRQDKRHDDTPIIVLSAKRLTDGERKNILRCRARFASKPISPTQLVELVEDELKTPT